MIALLIKIGEVLVTNLVNHCMKTCLILIATITGFAVQAADIDSATSIQNKTNRASVKSQESIDKSVQSANVLSADLNQLNEEIHNLTIYRNHLAALINSQENELTSLGNQLSEIKQTRQGIVPLMYDMLDGLQNIIESDKPIKKAQRLSRLNKLRKLMSQADVSEAEKYRRILEAYQIEFEYGNKMSTYRSQIRLNNNNAVEADVFYLGRAVLIARSLDKSHYWTWDQASQQWVDGDSDYLENINQAFALAQKQIAPTLLTLPLSLNNKEAK